MRQHSLQQVHKCIDAWAVYNNYIYLLMRQHSLQQEHKFTDAWAQCTASTYTYWCINSLQQVHTPTGVSTVYNKYIYLLMR
jgi:hypothetical protein